MNEAMLKAPFPYFGGKHKAAPIVWEALGDVGGYVEPFAGSAAVLLARRPFKGRRVETLNDTDGWLVNMWRSIQYSPGEVAKAAYGPVTEIDYHARLAWLQERRTPELAAWLEGGPDHHDPQAAGWWLYVCACGIGDPWNKGPWRVVDGHLRDVRELPHLGDQGRGVNRKLPHLGNQGRGVNRKLPHLGNQGRGVKRGLPHLGDQGQGDFDQLVAYLAALSDRMRRVRITCGDWRRVLKPSVTRATATNSVVGIFLDPPYSTSGDLYATTNTGHEDISGRAREWCLTAPPEYRIVIAGYEDEHDELLEHGWTVERGKSGSGAGYSSAADSGRRERLWLSPACLRNDDLFSIDIDSQSQK